MSTDTQMNHWFIFPARTVCAASARDTLTNSSCDEPYRLDHSSIPLSRTRLCRMLILHINAS